jgi:hypothetical protein
MNAAQQYQYVFYDLKQDMLSYLPVPAGFIAVLLLITLSRPRYYEDRHGIMQDRLKSGRNAIIVLVLLVAAFYGMLRYQLRISRHCAVTTGRLLNKEYRTGKGGGTWQYTYEYTAGAKTYREDKVYTHRLKAVCTPGNCYTVLYDSTSPANAIMLLHEERACAAATLK